MKNRRLICAAFALVMLISLAGCRGEQPQPSVAPAPTLAPDDSLGVAGKVELTLNAREYVVTCTSDIPEGAIVTIYLMDEFGNMLDVSYDIIQRDSRSTASFDAEGADDKARNNDAKAIVARVEFYPSVSVQPMEIQERYGAKGNKLAGDNVIMDDTTGDIGVRLESVARELPAQ
jgi:hypothetical protein